MKIYVKYHNPRLIKLDKLGIGDWIDLRAAEDVQLRQGEFRLISLGISVKLPEGYEAHIAPRSSSFKKWGFLQTNGVGIVDNSYSGTNDLWMLPVYATRDAEIKENDRICQFRIMKQMPELEFCETETLDDTDRGGFGATGTK